MSTETLTINAAFLTVVRVILEQERNDKVSFEEVEKIVVNAVRLLQPDRGET